MAERMLKSRLMRNGIHEVEGSSAGLWDMHGAPADMTARKILKSFWKKGINWVEKRLITVTPP
jgi:protein-tyrosine-phosphatase